MSAREARKRLGGWYTASERDAGLPQALRALGDALRAIGRAWYGDDRVPIVLPPP